MIIYLNYVKKNIVQNWRYSYQYTIFSKVARIMGPMSNIARPPNSELSGFGFDS